MQSEAEKVARVELMLALRRWIAGMLGEGGGGEGEGGGGEGEGGKNGQATFPGQHPGSFSGPHPHAKCGQQPQNDPEGFQHELLQ